MPDSHVLVKLDFTNAFNSVRRDVVREAVAANVPGLLGYSDTAYGETTHLTFGEFVVDSAEGVQQGYTLGSLLFCLAINRLLLNIKSELVSGYLDDIGIGGEVSGVIADIRRIDREASACGLVLNHSKCEVIGLTPSNGRAWATSGLQFAERPVAEATLLGTPIRAGVGVDRALACKRDDLVTLTGRLALLPAHTALFLLRNALAIPKLLYILRTAPCSDRIELAAYDEVVRSSLSSILNLTLPPLTWSQACLPVRWGGI